MDTRLVVSREDRKCWTFLDRIDEETLNLVKFFRSHSIRFFAALSDGRFIAAGKNDEGWLGLGHNKEVYTFEEITTLKGMSIKDIVCGSRFVMVLTEDGQVWGFGDNTGVQVGKFGKKVKKCVMIPTRILEKDVVNVKCGYNHTLALKKDGKVMVWGNNWRGQLGIGHTVNKPTPVFLLFPEDVIIDQIETREWHSIAVSREGKAYGWGWNWNYELGLGHKDQVLHPTHINVHNHSIKSVTCGGTETLFLTREGLMFVTNQKDKGTLTQLETKVPMEHILCVDHSLFLAWSSTELYYWGRGDTVPFVMKTKPILTDLSLSQIVRKHSGRQEFPTVLYMHQSDHQNMQQEEETKVNEITANSNVKKHLRQNASDLCDIEFVFSDNRTIKAQRAVLSLASPSLFSKLSSTWQSLAGVSLSSPSYSVFRHYLSYLYTHTLSFDDFDQLVSLVRLAHDYHEVDLQQVCVQHLCDQLDIDNCSQLYELAIDLKLEQLETQASQMIWKNIEQVRLTDGFKDMDREKAFTLFYKM